MRNGKSRQIEKQYKFDEDKKVYLIDVFIDDYDDVYDEWDPAPFKKRFIEEDFDEFIKSSSKDIPMKFKLNIVLYIPLAMKDENKEKSVEAAYKNYYAYNTEKAEIEWNWMNRRSYTFLFIALSLLGLGSLLRFEDSSTLVDLFKQGILVGGWVFLWEFITYTFMDSKDYKFNYKIVKRLHQSELRFIYY